MGDNGCRSLAAAVLGFVLGAIAVKVFEGFCQECCRCGCGEGCCCDGGEMGHGCSCGPGCGCGCGADTAEGEEEAAQAE